MSEPGSLTAEQEIRARAIEAAVIFVADRSSYSGIQVIYLADQLAGYIKTGRIA